jgi:hypothetical protein
MGLYKEYGPSWFAWFSKKQKTSTVSRRPRPGSIIFCPGVEYDFGQKPPGRFFVAFRTDCASRVVLPEHINFRTKPSTKVEITFVDGRKFVDTPGKKVDFGQGRAIFGVRGIKEAGTMEISFSELK